MITIYSDDHRYQNATAELNDGKLMPPFEMPRRAEMVLSSVKAMQLGEVIAPREFGLEPIHRIHDRGYVEFLQTAWEQWRIEHGEYDALPLNWAIRTMRSDRIPEVLDGKLGYYSFDAGTPITQGTWKAITASANVALTGQTLIANGKRSAFSLCRPPGHHAGKDFYGGYCFLNNVAIAAQAFRDAGAERVAILDIDYHHGNGTQAIFYDRSDVMFLSIHAHPAQDYPYFLGYDDETGSGDGDGFNHNYPLRWNTDWQTYSGALTHAMSRIRDYRPDALLISLGVDTFEGDPISRFRLKGDDYSRMGRAIASANLPTLFVLEGGYAVEEIGINAVNVLLGFESG
ncbi:MAG: histone deacetylase family protein [Elainellaceae cyanobacterium]